ncbi:MAG: hypothetical protein HZB26_07005 [Candidatus Hydrogenedentes bacterium]|nr:hypothetical protein [Candidatus Hydrogenedentota bacterium]
MNPRLYTIRIAALASLVLVAMATEARAADAQSLLAGVTNASADARAEAWKSAGPVGAAAIAPLGKHLAGADPGVTKAARAALVTIVAYAGRPGAAPTEGAAVAAELAKLLDKSVPDAARREVLNQLSLIAKDAEVPAIAAVLDEPTLAEDARMALERIPGDASVNALIAALDKAPEQLRGPIAASLAQRNAAGAIPKLTELARTGGHSDASWECIDALARLGVPPIRIIPRQTGFTQPESRRYMNALLTAAEALAAKGERGEAERYFASVAAFYDLPAQASVALNGLAKMGSDKVIPHAMGNLDTPELRRVAIQALIEANVPKIDGVAAKSFAISSPSGRSAILEILAGRKSEQLAALLPEAAADKSAEVRITAAAVSGKTPAEADLLEVATKGYPWSWEPAAAKYIEMAQNKLQAGDKEGARQMFENVLNAKMRSRYATAALDALGQIANPASRELVKGLMPDADLGVAAGRAFAEITGSLDNKDLAKTELLALTDQPVPVEVVSAAVNQLKKLGQDTTVIAKKKGFITKWRVVGPFPNDKGAAFGKSFFPEAAADGNKAVDLDGKSYAWKDAASDQYPAAIDLRAAFDPHDNVCAYGYAELTAAAEVPVLIQFGSDDGCELWINGEKKFEVNGGRPMIMDGNRVEAVLKPGVNKVLIKVLQGGGTWQYCLRVTDREGKPLVMAP